MGLPWRGRDSVAAARRSAAEPNSPPAAPAFFRCIAEQLCRSPAPLASPFVRRLYQPRRVQRPAEARLVQPSAEQKFVYLLQLRQREGGRQQMERNQGLVEPRAQRAPYTLDHRSLPGRQRRQVIHGMPRGRSFHLLTSLAVHERQKRHRQRRSRRMPAAAAERTGLFDQRRRGAERTPRELGGLVIDGLFGAQRSPRQLPALPGPGRRALEEHHEPPPVRTDDDDIDCRGGAARFGAWGRSASGHALN
jgi:hypothetical protein